jgi:hypothetical protein
MTDVHEALKRRGLADTWAHLLRAQVLLEAQERTRAEAERERAMRARHLNDHVIAEKESSK